METVRADIDVEEAELLKDLRAKVFDSRSKKAIQKMHKRASEKLFKVYDLAVKKEQENAKEENREPAIITKTMAIVSYENEMKKTDYKTYKNTVLKKERFYHPADRNYPIFWSNVQAIKHRDDWDTKNKRTSLFDCTMRYPGNPFKPSDFFKEPEIVESAQKRKREAEKLRDEERFENFKKVIIKEFVFDVPESKKFKLDYLKIIILGLDLEVNSQVVHKLASKTKETDIKIPIGFDISTGQYRNYVLSIWNITDAEEMKKMKPDFMEETKILIYILNSTDRDNIKKSSNQIQKIFAENRLGDVCLLIFAINHHHHDSVKDDELSTILGIDTPEFRERYDWFIQGINEKTGDGLFEALDDYLSMVLTRQASEQLKPVATPSTSTAGTVTAPSTSTAEKNTE